MKVVQQTPTQLVVHEGALKTVVLGAILVAVGGGLIVLRLADPSGWTGNGGPWLIYVVGMVFGLAGGPRQSTPFFRMVFLAKSGDRVPWTPYSTPDEGTLAACASTVRTFCGWASADGAVKVSALAAAPVSGGVSGHPVATSWGCVGGFLAIFVAVGLGLFASEVYRVETWQPVTARVLRTDIKAVRGDKGTSYTPVIRYQYSVNGAQYVSNQVLPLTISASYGWATRLRDRFHPGEIVTAYVNPSKPASAFLVRQVSLLPLAFVAIPLLMVGVLSFVAGVQRRQLAATVRYPVPIVDYAT